MLEKENLSLLCLTRFLRTPVIAEGQRVVVKEMAQNKDVYFMARIRFSVLDQLIVRLSYRVDGAVHSRIYLARFQTKPRFNVF